MGTILEAPPLPAFHHKCVDSCSHERTTSEKREENSSPTRFLLLSSPSPAPTMASRLSAIAWLAGSWTVASAAGLPCLSWVSCWYGAFLDPPLLCPLLVVSAFIANWSGYLYLFLFPLVLEDQRFVYFLVAGNLIIKPLFWHNTASLFFVYTVSRQVIWELRFVFRGNTEILMPTSTCRIHVLVGNFGFVRCVISSSDDLVDRHRQLLGSFCLWNKDLLLAPHNVGVRSYQQTGKIHGHSLKRSQ
jgi:hypothetical protein